MGDTLSILSPFIENNTKLRSLELGGCTVNDRFALLFESALSGCNTSLQRIELNRCEGMTADIMEKIINVVGSQGIQELYLDEYDWDDEVAAALGDTLCTNNTLKILSLGGEQFDHQQAIQLELRLLHISCQLQAPHRRNCLSEITELVHLGALL